MPSRPRYKRIMQVIEAQRASILVPYDHLRNNQMSTPGRRLDGLPLHAPVSRSISLRSFGGAGGRSSSGTPSMRT
jgi:hypothetical protein